MWLEEALPQDNLDAYARFKDETSVTLVLSELAPSVFARPDIHTRRSTL